MDTHRNKFFVYSYMPPKRSSKSSKKPPVVRTSANILSNLISNLELEKEFTTYISVAKVMEIIGKSGVFSKNYKSPAKTEFIKSCWKFYSGNAFSFVINKYMYLDRADNKLIVGNPKYTDEDMILVYNNLPMFKHYVENLLMSLATERLGGPVPNNMILLMELLVSGLKSTPHIRDEHPEFFMTTKMDTVLYRGFRMVGTEEEVRSILSEPNKSFVSTTTNIHIALQHAKPVKNEKSVLIIYTVDPNISLIEVGKIHTDVVIARMATLENELLLMPGHKFKILEKGIFNEESIAKVNLTTRKNTETHFLTGDVVEYPYYKIHISK